MDLSKRLEAYRAGGEVDSEGQFTIGLVHARDKLEKFLGTDRSYYLVLLVSAGVSLGAQSVTIQHDGCDLVVEFPGAKVSSRLLAEGFEKLLSGGGPSETLDLTLGLQGAFRAKALEVVLESQDSEGSFRWRVSAESEFSQESEEGGEAGIAVRIAFRERTLLRRAGAWLRTLRGYAGMSPECRAVDRYCDHSPVPITINGEPVNRPFHTLEAPAAAQLGAPPGAVVSTPRSEQWEGPPDAVLALTRGEVRFVVHGVTYPGATHLRLDGLVYCDHLKRDMSRQEIARDASYEELCASLTEVRGRLLRGLIESLSGLEERWTSEVYRGLRELFQAALLEHDEMEKVLACMKEAEGLGGLELQRLTLLRALCQKCEEQGLESELLWSARKGHELALETLPWNYSGMEDAELLHFFSSRLGDSVGFEELRSEFRLLKTWLQEQAGDIQSYLRDALLPNILRTLLRKRLRSDAKMERNSERILAEMIRQLVGYRLEPHVLTPALNLLAGVSGEDTQWAAETAVDLIRLSTERHGFRDDRLLRRYLDFRENCGRYHTSGQPKWSLGHLLTEAKFLRTVALREPGVVGRDIASEWAPLVLAGLEELCKHEDLAEEGNLTQAMGQIRGLMNRLGC